MVSYSNCSLLVLVAVFCPFVGSSSPTAGRVVVDGATSQWIPIVSAVPQGSVLGPLLFILYTSEMFELVENRLELYAYMLMTPHYWQLFACQQIDLLLLPPLTGTWLWDSGVLRSLVHDAES